RSLPLNSDVKPGSVLESPLSETPVTIAMIPATRQECFIANPPATDDPLCATPIIHLFALAATLPKQRRSPPLCSRRRRRTPTKAESFQTGPRHPAPAIPR